MKQLQLFALVVGLAPWLVSCETTDMAQQRGPSSQEAKHIAAAQRAQTDYNPDESDRNLWNAQRDVLVRDGNPSTRYY